MKTRFFMTMATAALVLAGCSNDENEPADNWNGEIRLTSGVTVQTRAEAPTPPDTQIADGQEVGVFINDATAGAAISANLKYNADGNGGLTLDDASAQPYYPATGNGVNIIAYQPYDASADIAGTTESYDFIVKTDQNGNSGKDYYDSDLLYSSKDEAYGRSKTAHALSFKHKLSKVVCTLQPGTGTPDLTGATVAIVAAETKGTFKPSDGTFTTNTSGSSSEADITMNSSITSASYIAVLPPQTFAKDAQFLKVTLSSSAGGGVFYYRIPNGSSDTDLVLAEGTVYKYDITVDQTGLKVSSSIENWTGVNEQPKTGNAEMD